MSFSLKRTGTDILGILLLVAALLLGWLPGPGGIPLFIAGLSLLAINHTWAQRLLGRAKKSGLRLSDVVFRNHPVWRLVIDVSSLALFVLGIKLFASATRNLVYGVAISFMILGLSLFLGNRHRLERVVKRLKP